MGTGSQSQENKPPSMQEALVILEMLGISSDISKPWIELSGIERVTRVTEGMRSIADGVGEKLKPEESTRIVQYMKEQLGLCTHSSGSNDEASNGCSKNPSTPPKDKHTCPHVAPDVKYERAQAQSDQGSDGVRNRNKGNKAGVPIFVPKGAALQQSKLQNLDVNVAKIHGAAKGTKRGLDSEDASPQASKRHEQQRRLGAVAKNLFASKRA